MLVISVIIALAILAVLMGFTGGITPFGTDAPTAATNEINKVTTDPGITGITEADFSTGGVLEAGTITAKTTLSADHLQIVCGANEPEFCSSSTGGNAQVVVSNNLARNVAGKKIKIALAACKRANKKTAVLCISSTESENDLLTGCIKACDGVSS